MCILCGEIGKNYSRTVGEMVVGKVIHWESGCRESNTYLKNTHHHIFIHQLHRSLIIESCFYDKIESCCKF